MGIFVILAIITICYGLVIRLYGLDIQSWWMDEGYSINAALSTIEKGYPILDSGWVYDGQIVYTYPLAASIKLFGLHNWSTRIPSVIFNMLFLGVIFQFCRRFFNKRVAILVTLFMTFSYWEIAWARQARNYAMFQLFFWISIYYFWDIIFNKFSYRKLIIWISSSLIALLTHGLAMLLIPIYAITFISEHWKKVIKEKMRILLRKETLIVSIALLVIVIIFETKITGVLTGGTLPSFYKTGYVKFIAERFTGAILIGLIPMIVFYKKLINRKHVLLIVYYLLFLITATFLITQTGYRYLFVVLPVIYILVATNIDKLVINKWLKIFTYVLLAVFIIVSGEFQITPTKQYFLESDTYPSEITEKNKYKYHIYTPQPNWEKAYKYIKDNRSPNDIIISTQPVFTKLYLGEKGYWISYDVNNRENHQKSDAYIDAHTLFYIDDIKEVIINNNGYIILDSLAVHDKIEKEKINFIKENGETVYINKENDWSQILVYKF